MTGAGDAAEERGLGDLLARLKSSAQDFDPRKPAWVARAPGRLDLMGGIADYSGSLVLELPLGVGTWAVAQRRDAPEIAITSEGAAGSGDESTVVIPLQELVPGAGAGPISYQRAREILTADRRRAWAAYVAGAVVVLHGECERPLSHGVRIFIHSDVPAGKGISSSAALEVATLEVLAPLVGAAPDERQLALLAQKVENFVVGAPCGVMDQMTAVSGRRDHLVEISCQPAELIGHVPLPPGLELFGIDSGIRHAVAGADYGSVRAAAFMGYRIIAADAGFPARRTAPGRVVVDDVSFGGYLANVSPALWAQRFRAVVPERLSGGDFLARYQGTTDLATAIDPDRSYAVRACTEHPIAEHARVRAFRDVLADGALDDDSRQRLGDLMYESHGSYSACGLGSDGTDRLVAMVRQAGAAAGLYGAKITGGGSGGTVAVLGRRGCRAAVEAISARYRADTGRTAEIFSGSSWGSRAFGVRQL